MGVADVGKGEVTWRFMRAVVAIGCHWYGCFWPVGGRRGGRGSSSCAVVAPAAMCRDPRAMMKRRLGPYELLGRASPCVSIREGVESRYEPAANESGHLIR